MYPFNLCSLPLSIFIISHNHLSAKHNPDVSAVSDPEGFPSAHIRVLSHDYCWITDEAHCGLILLFANKMSSSLITLQNE